MLAFSCLEESYIQGIQHTQLSIRSLTCRHFRPRHRCCLPRNLQISPCPQRERQIWRIQIRHTQHLCLSSTHPLLLSEWSDVSSVYLASVSTSDGQNMDSVNRAHNHRKRRYPNMANTRCMTRSLEDRDGVDGE